MSYLYCSRGSALKSDISVKPQISLCLREASIWGGIKEKSCKNRWRVGLQEAVEARAVIAASTHSATEDS